MTKLTKTQKAMLEKIQELQPVSVIRLGDIRGHSVRTFKSLCARELIEVHSKGMYGENWQVSIL